METKDTLSSCSDSEEQEMQRMHKPRIIFKENSINKINALKTTIQHLLNHDFPMNFGFKRAFYRLFGEDDRTFKFELTHNMKNLETQLNKETLHEQDSKSTFRMLNAQFQKFIHSEVLKTSNYEHDAREAREDFKQYTHIRAQFFKYLIIQNMDSIERQCKIQEVKATYASSGDTDSSGFITENGNALGLENNYSKTGNDQSSEKQSSASGNESSSSGNECSERSNSRDDTNIKPSYDTKRMVEVPYTIKYNVFAVETQHTKQLEFLNDTSLMEKVDSNTTPDSSDMCNNEFEDDQNADDHEDEKANDALTHELNEYKCALVVSNDIRDRCRSALRQKEVNLEKNKVFKNCQLEKEEIEHKYKETLDLLAQQKYQSHEALKR
ncbi:hypothetical protein Tco_1177671 [Tanacetum coccineum]